MTVLMMLCQIIADNGKLRQIIEEVEYVSFVF